MKVRASSVLALLAVSSMALAGTAGLYDDGEVFVDATAPDLLTCGGSASASIDVSGSAPQGVDLLLVLDESGSISAASWSTMLAAVDDLLVTYSDEIESGTLRVGIVAFSSKARLIYALNDHNDADEVRAAAASISQAGGETSTLDALTLALEQLDDSGDPSREWQLVLVSDGRPNGVNGANQNPCADYAFWTSYKAQNIQTQIVGVGSSWSPSMLDCLVDDTTTQITAFDEFSDLALTDVVALPSAASGASLSLTVDDSFLLSGASGSDGVLLQSGRTLTWNLGDVRPAGATLQLELIHDSATAPDGGTLDAIVSQTLSFTSSSGAVVSTALADVTIAVSVCDGDGDGVSGDQDCDDQDSSAYPGAVETCADLGVDNDCDGDEADASDALIWYADADGDGLGDAAAAIDACTQPSGYTASSGDLCAAEDATGYDLDGDGCLDDSDGDGVTDNLDAFPADPTESADTDGDGVGDSADAFPEDPAESADADGDGVGDSADRCFGFPNDDTDSDQVCDSDDVCPTDALDTDADADGVCDVEDVCVGTLNVDTDGDQVCDDLDVCQGNDATGDADADGICDGFDSCPTTANVDQADTDGDGIGDACETDSDGDGIDDDDDSCPADANLDQSDSDGDGEGDACDDDDDGDGVTDEEDVCPFYPDALQTDTDGDGLGDVCDGDDDGDGVSDDADLCPGTELDAPFDEDGCSGEQRIELECGTPEDYSWKASGRYISCVTREAQAAYRAGLITKTERAWLVKHATLELWLVRYIKRIRRWC